MTIYPYNIEVIIYAYKSKVVIDKIKNLLKTLSGENKILIRLLDQYQIDRSKHIDQLSEKYNKNCKIIYNHIFWDYIQSPIKLKEQRIKSSSANYILLIDDRVNLQQNWDKHLIDFCSKNQVIVSGNGPAKLEQINDFFIKNNSIPLDYFCLTNYISENFIFAKKEIFLSIENNEYILPSYLKYYGFEENFSLQCFNQDIPIYSAPFSIYTIDDKNYFIDFNLYVPFSKIHNYNQMIQLFLNSKNDYINLDPQKIKKFIQYHRFNFDNLSFLPHEKNDVLYATQDSSFDKMDGRRFLNGIKMIN